MVKQNIKVSVIVPVYNAEKYLHECMESLVRQTLKEIEIICINDGSTDNSLSILNEYASAYDNVFVYSQPDLGQGNAMNRGLRLANGEYVAECDSDDFANLDMYRKLYEAAKKYDSDAVRCGFWGVWDDGKLQRNPLHMKDHLSAFDTRALRDDEYGIIFGKLCSIFTGIYRRQFLLDNWLFWRDGVNYEDTCLEFKIRASAERYTFLDECLYYYRRGNSGSGTATVKDYFAIFEQYEEMERFAKEHGKTKFMEYMYSISYYTFMWMATRVPKDERKGFFEKCEEFLNEHPARKEYFNTEEDFLKYCIIKCGVWRETGVMA